MSVYDICFMFYVLKVFGVLFIVSGLVIKVEVQDFRTRGAGFGFRLQGSGLRV